ncbi:AAA family ATPase [Rhodoplanes sp. TEM]|uniref:AAA family ATPase n=1 Tax=Rhodoplanes tepidamans TaxID=200616 RepID=A0ABT5J8L0_RHOTP|nr:MULTISPECIES: AAA family ATPase [Rhodoplanes]MDC7785736.1 AAA family ATPase [Rhodoplanes tepidamans]MDC7986298.1 AAA family ATPase [Rhodoplanes sp. TEM]MDQ0354702.1 putative ATPase [Rhodoplanes tepidamans]
MLTRIEIDGFKSFKDLKLDLHPFTVVAGPNASGKSNFFDALRFLSQLASFDLLEAVRRLRGDPSELFRREPTGNSARTICFAAEVLLDSEVEDAFGQKRPLKHTRVRYELEIERQGGIGGPERLYVRHESARPIKRTDDTWLRRSPPPHPDFVKEYARYASGGGRSAFLETLSDKFQVNQDGVQGRPRPFPISKDRATATVLSRITTATEFPHLFALRQELASITFLQLEATSEREPSDALAPDELLPDGSNLAKVLARIETETRTVERPRGDLADIRNSLTALIPGTKDLRIERDESAGRYRLFISMRGESEFSSRVLSDGTLRVLALLTFLYDPRRRGVLLFEEPENGVHEDRLVKLIRLLRGTCSNVHGEEKIGGWLFQILVNTHSPVVLRETQLEELVVADVVSSIDPTMHSVLRHTRMRTGVVENAEFDFGDRERRLTRIEAERITKGNDAAI